MINIVEKQYVDGNFACYRITYSNGKTVAVPHAEDNRHYQDILEWVANGGTIVDNGS